jgi:hypothetical protein
MRTIATFAAVLAAATPLAAQQHQHSGATQHTSHTAQHAAPAGWQVRLDRANADRNAVHFMAMGEGFHVTSGPAAVFFNPQNTRSGNYRLAAEFAQGRAPEHPEAYGLVLAARNLDAANQDYMYFIVRGTGEFAVKHRAGEEVHTIADWTAHQAIHRQGPDGKATNQLAVDVGADAISFLVNGTQVYRIDRAAAGHQINTSGIYGVRVNHNLDVHVSGLQVTAR